MPLQHSSADKDFLDAAREYHVEIPDCDESCWIKASWNRPVEISGRNVITEHAPATKETMQQMAKRLYSPLRFYQFRILKLGKGSVATPFECTLHTATITHLQQIILEDTCEPLVYDAVCFSLVTALHL